MSVVSLKEGFTGVTAGGSGSMRTATRVFTAVTDDPADHGLWTYPLTVGAVTIPEYGTPHPDKSTYYSRVPQVTKKSATFFEIKVPYETPSDSEDETEDPLSKPAEYTWDDAERTVPYDRDLDNNPVINTMDERFDPPLTREISDPVLIIERNEADFDPDVKLDYQDTVSVVPFFGAAAYRAKLGKVKARSVTLTGGTVYWVIRYEIHFRMKTPSDTPEDKYWFRCVLNQGMTYVDKGSGIDRISPTGEPVNIDLDGYRVSNVNAVWLYFREYFDTNWPTALGLPYFFFLPPIYKAKGKKKNGLK